MGISVENRIWRKLRKLERFTPCDQWNQLPQFDGVGSPLDDGEKLIGTYENVPGTTGLLLLFTNEGLHLREGSGWRSLKYTDIANYEPITVPKLEADTLVLRMKAGTREQIPILGGTEFTRDIFSVMTFLNGVFNDMG